MPTMYEDTWYNYLWFKAFKMLVTPFLKSGFYGSQTTMVCMLDDNILQYNGDYFQMCGRSELEDFAKDEKIAKNLWEDSVKLVRPWLD